MADYYTPQQRAAMDAVLAGTFDRLDTAPRVQPGYTMDQIYGGILPSGGGSVPRPINVAAAPSYPTPAQLAAMDYVGSNAYQAPPNRPMNIPTEPSGFSYADTGDRGRATPAMRQQLAIGVPTTAPMPAPQPTGLPWNAMTSIDQAAIQRYAQAAKPAGPVTPNWTTIGPLLAQASFRQNAIQKNYPLPPPAPAPVKTPWGQMSQQLFQQLLATQQPAVPGKAPTQITVRGGKTTPSQNYSLANALGAVTKQGATGTSTNGYNYSNGQNVGQSAQYAGMSPSQMYDAINARAGNPTSSGNSSSLTSMGSSPQEGGTPDWVAHARPLYDSQGNISGWAKNVR